MDTIDIDGNVIDHLEVSKSSNQLNEKYLDTAVSMEEIQLFQNSDLGKKN
jgi:hypothetical protein